MKNQITENQFKKMKKLEDELRTLWELLTPSERERRSVFSKFLELQRQVQEIQLRNQILKEKEMNNEQSIRKT